MTGLEPQATPEEPGSDLVEPTPRPKLRLPRFRMPSWRLLGVLLSFAASILTLLGSFMTLFRGALRFGGVGDTQLTLIISAWDIRAEADGRSIPAGAIAENGAPLVFAATLLLAAALLGLLANAVPARVGIGRANILLAAAGAAFLAGTTWTIGMQELSWQETFGSGSTFSPEDSDVSVSAGYWLLIVGTVAALAAPVLAWLPARPRSERVEPETPPFGTPVVVVHRLPDAPADGPD